MWKKWIINDLTPKQTMKTVVSAVKLGFLGSVFCISLCLSLGLPQMPLPDGILYKQRDPYIVHNDPGGSILDRSLNIFVLRLTGQEVRISDYCASACTFYISLPNACFEPNTKLAFHGPSVHPILKPFLSMMDQYTGWYYPEPIRTEFYNDWKNLRGQDAFEIRAYALENSGVKICHQKTYAQLSR